MDKSRRVLLTGAMGRIGSSFFREKRDRYAFVLADRSAAIHTAEVEPPHRSTFLDIADSAACRAACEGIDTVVHLAADPSPEADFHESLLENNLAGTFNVFRAAADAGCRRVIFASSVHAMLGYPPGPPVLESDPVWPLNMYGVSKCFGEATARKFASFEGISAIAIRIGAYEAPWIARDATPPNLSMFLSSRDMNQLLSCCIEVDDLDFAILHGISDNREKRLSIGKTCMLTGYEPVDDGFELYQVVEVQEPESQ